MNEKLGSLKDTQHGGQHYKGMAIEPSQYCEANGIGFNEGSAIKYLSRHALKGGATDLKKAIHFTQMVLEAKYGVRSEVAYRTEEVREENTASAPAPKKVVHKEGLEDYPQQVAEGFVAVLDWMSLHGYKGTTIPLMCRDGKCRSMNFSVNERQADLPTALHNLPDGGWSITFGPGPQEVPDKIKNAVDTLLEFVQTTEAFDRR